MLERRAHPEMPPTWHDWRRRYVNRVALTDLLVLLAAAGLGSVSRLDGDSSASIDDGVRLPYIWINVILVAVWWIALLIYRTREEKIVGEGVDEYRRTIRGTFAAFGFVAIATLLLRIDVSREYLAITFPLGLVGLVAGRKGWRWWLVRHRRLGHAVSNVLVIGGPRSARQITETMDANFQSGFRVTGVWVPDREGRTGELLDVPGRPIPVLGNDRDLIGALRIASADAVIVTDSEHLGHDGLKSLAWELEGVDVDLMVSPNVIDVAGPRIHLRAVANMPLIHLEEPQYAEATQLAKIGFDKTAAIIGLMVASPIMLVAAVAVKVSSPGPILYRSTRIGVHGEPFDMLKFRSMVDGADVVRGELAEQDEGAGLLFKIKGDPRVTKVGGVLRRFSIDELPQLLNVLRGEMSLVGPRPPLPAEVEAYDGPISRRLLVRQGITGLWQVSGRSDLTWEESVRLDLDYVENWSMLRDVHIIWRTIKAVLLSRGAY